MNLQIPDLQSKIRRNQELYFSNIIYFKRTIPYIINFKTLFIQRWSVYVVLLFKTWLEKNSRSKRTCIDHCINNLILQNHNSLLLFVQNYHVCACFFSFDAMCLNITNSEKKFFVFWFWQVFLSSIFRIGLYTPEYKISFLT